MTTKKDYANKCFSPNWIEIDLGEVEQQTLRALEEEERLSPSREQHQTKEERLEDKRRKDLTTLLKELDEIKENIERAVEKQHRLTNLMKYYTGDFA